MTWVDEMLEAIETSLEEALFNIETLAHAQDSDPNTMALYHAVRLRNVRADIMQAQSTLHSIQKQRKQHEVIA